MCRAALTMIALATLAAASGCQTTTVAPGGWRWPWQREALAGDFNLPPTDDPRFTKPPTFPKSVMTPQLKREQQMAGPNPNGPPGVGPPMRPVGGGNFIQ